MARPWLTLTLLLSTSCLILQVSAIPKCSRTLFGEPNFEACRQLLQGNRYAPAYRGIDRIDRVSHLFTVWPQYLQGLQGWPRGVTERQYDNRVRLPQPDYATWLAGPDARGIGVPDGREFHHPRPWSKDGCNITLLPKIGPNGLTWDTGKWKPIAEVGLSVNFHCVRPTIAGGRASGGLESAGDNGRMLMALYSPTSEFAKRVAANPDGVSTELRESEVEEESNDDAGNPPNPKRLKIDPPIGTQGSSNQVPLDFNTAELSSSIGSGWLLTFNDLKLIPGSIAATSLVKFYNSVIDKASELLEAATPLGKQHIFTVGSVSLLLAGTDVIYWDWIITFAMAMVDSTNENSPIQFASTIASEWQQNTIKAELFLGGKGLF